MARIETTRGEAWRIEASKNHEDVTIFRIWPDHPSLTPALNWSKWHVVWKWLQQHRAKGSIEAVFRQAMATYQSEIGATCETCGKEIEFVEWTNGVQDMRGDSAWIADDKSVICGTTPDSQESYAHAPAKVTA